MIAILGVIASSRIVSAVLEDIIFNSPFTNVSGSWIGTSYTSAMATKRIVGDGIIYTQYDSTVNNDPDVRIGLRATNTTGTLVVSWHSLDGVYIQPVENGSNISFDGGNPNYFLNNNDYIGIQSRNSSTTRQLWLVKSSDATTWTDIYQFTINTPTYIQGSIGNTGTTIKNPKGRGLI